MFTLICTQGYELHQQSKLQQGESEKYKIYTAEEASDTARNKWSYKPGQSYRDLNICLFYEKK